MPGPTPAQVRHILKKPIVLYKNDGSIDETVTTLTLRTEFCAGDMRGVPMRHPLWAEDILKLIGRLSGQPDLICNRLGMVDFNEVGALVMGFMGGSQEEQEPLPGTDGTTPSP